LALHGISRAQTGPLTAALEAELAQLAGQPGQSFVAVEVLQAPPLRFAPAGDPERTGRAIAAALWAGTLRAGKE
jgi:hypothetical protein